LAVILVLNYTIGILFLSFGTPIGTPIGLLISKYKLDKYSNAVYGEHVFPDGLPRYDLKSSDYTYKLVSANNEIVSELAYRIPKDMFSDSNFKVKFDLASEIKAIDNELGEDVYLPFSMIAYGIDGSQDFSQQPLKRIDKLYLGIENINVNLTPQQSKEEFFKIVSFTYKKLGDKYNFTSSQITYTDINGVLETYMSAKEGMMPYKKVNSKIRALGLGEMEKKFIKQLEAVRNGSITKDMLEIRTTQ
jgi:hypothetical protein